MKKYRKICCFLIVLFVCQFFSQQVFAETIDGTGEYLQKVFELIQDEYIEETDEIHLLRSTLEGIFNGLDEYTVFYTPEEVEFLLSTVEGIYAGIGAELIRYGDYTVVYKVLPGTPAERGGLLAGDKIAAIDGVNCWGLSVETTTEMIKGEKGTKVILDIIRKGYQEPLKKELERDDIEINPVSLDIVEGTGYLKISVFNENVEKHFEEALKEMDSQNITKMILDLRDNPGGDVYEAVAVAQQLVPKGLITRLVFASKDREDLAYYSELEKTKYDLIVLVNKDSASASEILAGAIQDSGAGTLVGTQTFGKSKVQNIYPLLTPQAYNKYAKLYNIDSLDAFDLVSQQNVQIKNEEIIGWTKITTGEYFTPKGRSIGGVGLAPDIAIADYDLVDGLDIRGIDKLRKTDKPGLNMEGVDVVNAEKILKLLGYEVNEPDIMLDENTFNALKEFQRDKGLYSYGVLDFVTQQTLNDELDKLIKNIDRPFAKALELLSM